MMSPTSTDPDGALHDEQLVALCVGGDGRALEALLRRHEGWVFNLAMFMLQIRQDAEDASQEILLKLTTNLASFQGTSSFRTWAHRVAVNHILDRRRSQAEQRRVHGFECLTEYLHRTDDTDIAATGWSAQEQHVLAEEVRRACTLGKIDGLGSHREGRNSNFGWSF